MQVTMLQTIGFWPGGEYQLRRAGKTYEVPDSEALQMVWDFKAVVTSGGDANRRWIAQAVREARTKAEVLSHNPVLRQGYLEDAASLDALLSVGA